MTDFAQQIAGRLREDLSGLRAQFAASAPIRHFVVDDVLSPETAGQIHAAMPAAAQMRLRNSFRERKYVSAQMDRHAPELEEALFAFQDSAVLEAIRQITGKADLQPDPQLYAGGVSLMGQGHFLNPHVDNSHDGERARWRNLNLLYYVSPDWDDASGGDLELWPQGIQQPATSISCRFNRLVVMETHHQALHSVKPIKAEALRGCVSNYYFAPTPMRKDQSFHVTSFRARPEQRIRDVISRADSAARGLIRKVFKKGLVASSQQYRRDDQGR